MTMRHTGSVARAADGTVLGESSDGRPHGSSTRGMIQRIRFMVRSRIQWITSIQRGANRLLRRHRPFGHPILEAARELLMRDRGLGAPLARFPADAHEAVLGDVMN